MRLLVIEQLSCPLQQFDTAATGGVVDDKGVNKLNDITRRIAVRLFHPPGQDLEYPAGNKGYGQIYRQPWITARLSFGNFAGQEHELLPHGVSRTAGQQRPPQRTMRFDVLAHCLGGTPSLPPFSGSEPELQQEPYFVRGDPSEQFLLAGKPAVESRIAEPRLIADFLDRNLA